MKLHTTNYQNTFIEAAEDCPATVGEVPPLKGDKRSVANMQFDLIAHHPYQYTSDDVLFQVYASRNNIPAREMEAARAAFFSKGQACLRASPLTKRYGWGVHCDEQGKVAIYGRETEDYRCSATNPALKQVKAMKSKK